jgi:hypothetical protein
MRTTVEFDPDVAVELKRLRKLRDVRLKELVNDIVRRGIRDINAPPKKKVPFRTKSLDLGKPVLPNVDNIHEISRLCGGRGLQVILVDANISSTHTSAAFRSTRSRGNGSMRS